MQKLTLVVEVPDSDAEDVMAALLAQVEDYESDLTVTSLAMPFLARAKAARLEAGK